MSALAVHGAIDLAETALVLDEARVVVEVADVVTVRHRNHFGGSRAIYRFGEEPTGIRSSVDTVRLGFGRGSTPAA